MSVSSPFAREFSAKQRISADYDLSPGDVRDALRVNSPALVAEVFSFAKLTAAEEIARQTRIDMKANLLLGAIGISISVATVLLPRAGNWIAQSSLGVAAVLSLCAGYCAVLALRVLTYARVADRTIFNDAVLEEADNAEDERRSVALYQRYVTGAMWDVHLTYVKANDRRAVMLAKGQTLFLAALGVAIVGGLALVFLR